MSSAHHELPHREAGGGTPAQERRPPAARPDEARADLECLVGDLSEQQFTPERQIDALSWRLTLLEGAPGMRRFVRSVWRALRRRQVVLTPRPSNDVVYRDAAASEWESVGSDPGLELVPRGRYPTGWVQLDFELVSGVAGARPPLLHVGRGGGYTPSGCIRLPWPEGGRIRAVANLATVVHSLRLDPLDRPGTFRLGRLAIREMGRPEVGLRLAVPALWSLMRRPRRIPGAVADLVSLLRAGGLQALKNRMVGKDQVDSQAVRYSDWVAAFDTLAPADRVAITRRLEALPNRPLLSVVMPAYNTPRRWLTRAIESVRAQLYPEWELCVANDASTAPHVRRVLDAYARRDPRVRVVHRETNGHISEASNSALAVARGDYVVLMDSDDQLPPHALYVVAEQLCAHPETDLLYSDEDKIDERGRRFGAYFKPDWNPDLFLSQNYFSHLGVYRTSLVREVGGFRSVTDGSQDYDLALRCVARTRAERIRHVPHVLYHWRAIEGSGAMAADAKAYAHPAAERAVRDLVAVIDRRIEVSAGPSPTTYRVRWPLPVEPLLVSLIVPMRNGRAVLERCVESVLGRTNYPRLELLVVDNQADDPATLQYLASLAQSGRARVLRYDRPFNHSAINNFAARAARGTVLGLVNDDIEVIGPGWLSEMVSQALRPGIGAVGARLLYANDTVQHAGIVTGLNGLAGHVHRYLPSEEGGYFGRARLVQNVSAVTGACLVVRREVFEQVGGLDEHNLPVAFNDVDFCLRLEEAGYRNLFTPYAELYHHEPLGRGADDTPEKRGRFQREFDYMLRRWGDRLRGDRYYSPNLSLGTEVVEIAWPPRAEKPWLAAAASATR